MAATDEANAGTVSVVASEKLLKISRSLGDRLREAKNELAKEIASTEQLLRETELEEGADEQDANLGATTEMFMEIETEDEKMRSTYWGLKLLIKTGTFDAATPIYSIWLAVVSLAFSYNLWAITLREAFPRYAWGRGLVYWLVFDYVCDLIYLLDVFLVKTRIVYHNEDGLMVTDFKLTRRRYLMSQSFKLDLLALLPLDFLYLVPGIGIRPILRFPRLLRIRAFWEFFDRLSSLMDTPESLRILKILVYILVTVHIYTCGYYAFSVHVVGINANNTFAYEGEESYPDVYSRCFYIAFKIATSINSDKYLNTTEERAFMIVAWLAASFVVVVLLAQIRETFFDFTREEDEYTRTVHTALSYMKRYNCPVELEDKVRSWFSYTRSTQRVLEIQKVLSFLPKHLQTALALEINYKTLSKVTLFANLDRTVLTDLVVKLKPVLYLPGDYICTKGEIGNEMYIIVKGQAEVVGPQGQIFVTMTSGAVFGEISLLAVGGANRRTATVRSKGFSNLFTLLKDDFEEIMKQYPLLYARLKRKVADTLAKSKTKQTPPPEEAPKVEEPETEQVVEAPASGSLMSKEPKLLQILKALVPKIPSLKRVFRVEPVNESPLETVSISDSVDIELSVLAWSSASPDEFYIRTETEQQFWDAPDTIPASRAEVESNPLVSTFDSNDETYTSVSSESSAETPVKSSNSKVSEKQRIQPPPSSKYYFPSKVNVSPKSDSAEASPSGKKIAKSFSSDA